MSGVVEHPGFLIGLCALLAAATVVIIVGLVMGWRQGASSPVSMALRMNRSELCPICGRDFHARGCFVPAVWGVCALPGLLVALLVFMVAALVQDREAINFGAAAFGLMVFDSMLLWYAPQRGRFNV
jgi:hypothetical protein